MPKKNPPGPPSGKGRPTPREAVARAQAAAGPAVARAQAKAGPKVEQAASKAGSLLGTLRDRAKETAKSFSDGYGDSPDAKDESPAGGPSAATPDPDKPRPRPRPRPN